MILIIGGSGFIGYYLHQGFVKSKKRVISTYNTNKIEEENFIRLDVNNKKNLGKLINELKPSIIIYAVGITDVDLCEKNKKLAKEINCDGIKNIVDVTKSSIKVGVLYQSIISLCFSLFSRFSKILRTEFV